LSAYQQGKRVFAVDPRACHITIAVPPRRGGVAGIVVALGNARIDVTRIEPCRHDGSETYRLTVVDRRQLAIAILQECGCRIVGCVTDPVGVPKNLTLTARR
jgi:hypothetical protein